MGIEEMNDKEKEFVKNVNIDKAKNKTMTFIVLTIISLLSYVMPLMLGDFDFGMVFEILSLIFIFHAELKFLFLLLYNVLFLPLVSIKKNSSTFI